MADLHPESWLMASDTDNANNSLASLFCRRKQPVTDIAVWVQCYSSLVSVLLELYPQFIKHFMAYLSTIVMGAKRTRTLNAAYRRKAAATKSLFWGTVAGPVLVYYLVCQPSYGHGLLPVSARTMLPTTAHAANTAIPVLGQAFTAYHQPATQPMQPLMQPSQRHAHPRKHTHYRNRIKCCGLFNANGGAQCPYNPCRYRAHPASQCQQAGHKRPGRGWRPPAKKFATQGLSYN